MGFPSPSLSYFLTASDASLESFELARLNSASNLRKELNDVVEEWVEAEVQARMARLIRQGARMNHTASESVRTEIAAPSSQIELLPRGSPTNQLLATETLDNDSPRPCEALVCEREPPECCGIPPAVVDPTTIDSTPSIRLSRTGTDRSGLPS